ncbi:ParB/RepB/Spo0J family partition protein [Pacificibacter marinus]|uniref:ParB/RepB/Spo0J family partition protein n=1 Tax=Pacificibacter marinus TaxID=658057 RepID=UPI001C076BFE|nr:ParB/RepB/Spo0J family partition protein [Pacificibacter marinus]MBU2867113.1 ParB/RepB/Spo0J family partition protein [Pacificibacter marinus]
MSKATLMQMDRVVISDVKTDNRLRPIVEAGVDSLIASINETGVMKDAIHVRKKHDGTLHLIAGCHRIEAAKRLGWDDIEAKVWTNVTDDWALLMEIDDNLAGAEMNALDTAVFLATRKAVYERLHPETKADAFKGNQHTGKLAADIMSFATSTAEKFNLTERHIRRVIAAGSILTSDDITQLRAAPKQVTLKDLTEISKIGETTERSDVVTRLAAGTAKSATDARKQINAKPGDALISDADKKLRALQDAFARAPMAARRAFVADNAEVLRDLLDALGDEAAPAAEIVPFMRAGTSA